VTDLAVTGFSWTGLTDEGMFAELEGDGKDGSGKDVTWTLAAVGSRMPEELECSDVDLPGL